MILQDQSIRRPENFRIAKVLRTCRITPRMQRVTAQVDDLSCFDCPLEALGPHIHALFPRPELSEPGWPTVDEKGQAVYPPPELRPAIRTYSVRRFNHAENSMDIDFVLHDHAGIASGWATRTAIGDEIGLWRPHARILDEQPPRYVLGGDHSALPAIGFILDHLPDDTEGDVIVMIPDRREELPLRLPPKMCLRWLYSPPTQGSGNMLISALRSLSTSSLQRSFVWLGAEASVSRDIRAYVRKECGLPSRQISILNYWKRGMTEGTFDHGE